ncbi:uncharacterized protein LOC111617638 [Centruroides sculpturatus]|uniref:uncharacterized protein LOC111617638 n=1 Tax=Centruroides sculpturatus TaxID=218467 RepID=UPI000C6E66E7|nr:uncharacterized protein LOC111617638 [Centruroides sculpturatus]
MLEEIHSSFFTVTYYETINAESKKELQIMIRFWSEQKKQVVCRHLNTCFLGRADAETLHTYIIKAIDDANLSLHKLLMIGSDGPNVNQKVLRLFKEDILGIRKKSSLQKQKKRAEEEAQKNFEEHQKRRCSSKFYSCQGKDYGTAAEFKTEKSRSEIHETGQVLLEAANKKLEKAINSKNMNEIRAAHVMLASVKSVQKQDEAKKKEVENIQKNLNKRTSSFLTDYLQKKPKTY